MNRIDPSRAVFVVLGSHLFPFSDVRPYRGCRFFMAEDAGLCEVVRHHRQKIVLFLAAMRSYRDELRRRGCTVHYEALTPTCPDSPPTYEDKLARYVVAQRASQLVTWEVEDKFFEQRLESFATEHGLDWMQLPSPMFLTTRAQFSTWLDGHRPNMGRFYSWQRQRLGILVDSGGAPVGGRWSYDADNRKPLPKDQVIPQATWARPTPHVTATIPIVQARFADHPGQLSSAGWWLPTTRRQALDWLREFIAERLELFGPYEDALSTRDPILFHSVLSPLLNLGLLTPREVVDRVIAEADAAGTRLNSVEGVVRQIIGWREFVRGIYRHYSTEQDTLNFFDHQRQMTPAWFDGTTGLRPLDDVIAKALRFGWAHHIERLMVVGNLMTLCEIEPREAHRWFMELFVDSADWVMGPNVYGMGIFSDGGIFATKPYLCGSNYIRKMGDYSAPPARSLDGGGPPWTVIMDGLYWRFIDRHREFFRGQARLATAVATLDRMTAMRRTGLMEAAEGFLERATC